MQWENEDYGTVLANACGIGRKLLWSYGDSDLSVMTYAFSHRLLYLPHPNHKLGECAFEVEFAFEMELVEFDLIALASQIGY